ncbi:hypothetical protein [Streptomyces sp. NRRL B-3648]|uniref:hypothetical protein n=1 Tax=Streptomyces sp. NRRL B-3648 TaxID=1519493 RepID=UPI0006AFEEF0|nr:hypothetical protein [Streptomyces sp. NRRL B-3648]
MREPEPDDPSLTVQWDDPWHPGERIPEPLACLTSGSRVPSPAPDRRCRLEPGRATVARARARHGTVFSVTFRTREYRTLSREGWRRARS